MTFVHKGRFLRSCAISTTCIKCKSPLACNLEDAGGSDQCPICGLEFIIPSAFLNLRKSSPKACTAKDHPAVVELPQTFITKCDREGGKLYSWHCKINIAIKEPSRFRRVKFLASESQDALERLAKTRTFTRVDTYEVSDFEQGRRWTSVAYEDCEQTGPSWLIHTSPYPADKGVIVHIEPAPPGYVWRLQQATSLLERHAEAANKRSRLSIAKSSFLTDIVENPWNSLAAILFFLVAGSVSFIGLNGALNPGPPSSPAERSATLPQDDYRLGTRSEWTELKEDFRQQGYDEREARQGAEDLLRFRAAQLYRESQR